MIEQDIMLAAFNGSYPEEIQMRMPEELLYYEACEIAREFRTGAINTATATLRKNEVFKKYRKNSTEYENGKDAQTRIGQLYKDIEMAANRYRKERTDESGNALLESIYGKVFKRMKQKQ